MLEDIQNYFKIHSQHMASGHNGMIYGLTVSHKLLLKKNYTHNNRKIDTFERHMRFKWKYNVPFCLALW